MKWAADRKRAPSSVGGARAQDAEVTERLAAVAAASRSGASPVASWEQWFQRPVALDVEGAPSLGVPDPVGAEVRSAARLAHRSGVPLADVLDALARVERARRSARQAREAALAGPRASARLLAWLPLAGLGIAAIVEPGVARVVFATPLGLALLGVGAGLTVAGQRWMRASVTHAEEAGGAREAAPGLVAVCALLAAALRAGLDVRSALLHVAEAAGGPAAALADVAAKLARGVGWSESWSGVPAALAPLCRALKPAWEQGSSPVAALEAAAEAALDRSKTKADAAAAELGVRLAVPLAVCLLPAFVVVGIVPLLLAVGGAVVNDLNAAP